MYTCVSTHVYVYLYIYMCMYTCVSMCGFMHMSAIPQRPLALYPLQLELEATVSHPFVLPLHGSFFSRDVLMSTFPK